MRCSDEYTFFHNLRKTRDDGRPKDMMHLKNVAVIIFSFCTCPSADPQYFNLLARACARKAARAHVAGLCRCTSPTGWSPLWSPLALELPSIVLVSEVEESAANIAGAANTLTGFNEKHKLNVVMSDGDRATRSIGHSFLHCACT